MSEITKQDLLEVADIALSYDLAPFERLAIEEILKDYGLDAYAGSNQLIGDGLSRGVEEEHKNIEKAYTPSWLKPYVDPRERK